MTAGGFGSDVWDVWDVLTLRDWTMSGFTEHPHPAGRSLFRLETLDQYEVASDGSDYRRYLTGEPEPDPQRMGRWLDRLRDERARGLDRSRVHILRTPLHPYLRFECEWAYLHNVRAGERVGILDTARIDIPNGIAAIDDVGDFWLLRAPGAPSEVIVMHYDADGGFVGAEPVAGPAPYVAVAELAETLATPFTDWWAEHPAEHRINWIN